MSQTDRQTDRESERVIERITEIRGTVDEGKIDDKRRMKRKDGGGRRPTSGY